MTCPLCGKASPCVHTRRNTSALVDHQADHDIFAANFPSNDQALAPPVSPVRAVAGEVRPAADPAWRREIVSRVQQHRARRRRQVDPNAMELDFPADGPHSFGIEPEDGRMPPPPERFHEIVIPQNMVKPVMGRPEPPKVIRFPRTQPAYVPTVEEVMLDELEQAAPAPESPRIMEAYEAEPMEIGARGNRAHSRSSQSQDHPCGASRWSCCPALTTSNWSLKKRASITTLK